jgi:hypothetical protein
VPLAKSRYATLRPVYTLNILKYRTTTGIVVVSPYFAQNSAFSTRGPGASSCSRDTVCGFHDYREMEYRTVDARDIKRAMVHPRREEDQRALVK